MTAFLPAPPLAPHPTASTSPHPRCMTHQCNPAPPSISRRALLSALSSLPLTTLIPPSHATPVETDTVFLDISVAGKPAGRVLLALYRHEAPVSVDTFVKLATGTLRNRAGRTAAFKYSQAAKVVRGHRVQLGRIKQIDALNQQPGTAQRLVAGVQPPQNTDDNSLSHDQAGLVSVPRGGAFEFSLMLAPDRVMDTDHLVIGRVLDGMDVVERLGNVPTNRKTIRDGYRSIGKVIGDARAKVDVRISS